VGGTAATTAATSAATPREPAPAAARKPPPTAATQSPAAAPRPVAKPAEPEPKLPSLAELPDDVRSDVPAITIGGSIYSKSAANRMVVINGQVFHEGDALATGLVLEQIRPKSAVLRFRTHRYEITY
jgi:general secretion pathway protein B